MGTTYLAMGPGSFAAFNIALVIIWLGLSLLIGIGVYLMELRASTGTQATMA